MGVLLSEVPEFIYVNSLDTEPWSDLVSSEVLWEQQWIVVNDNSFIYSHRSAWPYTTLYIVHKYQWCLNLV